MEFWTKLSKNVWKGDRAPWYIRKALFHEEKKPRGRGNIWGENTGPAAARTESRKGSRAKKKTVGGKRPINKCLPPRKGLGKVGQKVKESGGGTKIVHSGRSVIHCLDGKRTNRREKKPRGGYSVVLGLPLWGGRKGAGPIHLSIHRVGGAVVVLVQHRRPEREP